MADITWDDVVALASELEDVPVEAQTILLEYANSALNPAMFTTGAYKLARIYLVAHMGSFAVPGSGASAGEVVSETVGGITRAYAATAAAAGGDGFDSTDYGTTYRFLIRTSKARVPRVF